MAREAQRGLQAGLPCRRDGPRSFGLQLTYQKGTDEMNTAEIVAWQKKLRAFGDTEIGRLFNRYDAAIGNAWVVDSTSGSDQRVKREWAKADQARHELLTKICGMAGIDCPVPEPTK